MPTAPILADRLAAPSLARNIILAVFGASLLYTAAKIQVPFWPVPMTMQTFVVLVLGAAYGWRLGAATVLLYLAEGAAGLPVFAGTPEKGIGLAYMAGPTGGFLAGFVVAAAIAGAFARAGYLRNMLTAAGALLVADVALFALGTVWLGTVIGWDKPILSLAVTPFLAAEAVKIALAVAVLRVSLRSTQPLD